MLEQAEYLSKITFSKTHVLCHDVNQITKTATNLDVIMGTSSGDILWYEPFSQKYSRINKTVLLPLPSSPSPMLTITAYCEQLPLV